MRSVFCAVLSLVASLAWNAPALAQVATSPTLTVGTSSQLSNSDARSQQMSKFRLAIAKARNGTADAKILFVGDSTTFGVGSSDTNVPPNTGFPARVSSLLNSSLLATSYGHATGKSSFGATTDTRWSAGTGWSTGSSFGWAGGSVWTGVSPAGNLVCTPGSVSDTYDVYYVRFSSGGTITCTASGGTPVVQSTNGASGIVKVACSAASASGSNTVTISATGTIYVVGIEGYKSATKQLRIANAGLGGSRSTNWNNGNGLDGVAAIKAYAPDLTFICLGINDTSASPATTSSAYRANIQALIDAAKVSGDVALITIPPANAASDAAGASLIATYSSEERLLALVNNLPLVDVFYRYGSSYNTGFMSDTYHPNNLGYWDWATAVVDVIRTQM